MRRSCSWPWAMIRVRALGFLKRALGQEELQYPSGVKLGELLERLAREHAEFRPEAVLVAVNGVEANALAGRETVLRDGDEVALIPVIHGGRVGVRVPKP
jgi:molybdopterin converting factor small subunit